MSLAQVGNDLNKDALLFLQHKIMESSEEKIYRACQNKKHLQASKDQGENYGWSNNIAMIETTHGVHLSVYDYRGLITNQMVETESQAIWTIVNDSNIT